MDVVLVGLSGSGKSVIGKRLAHREGAEFVDTDERIEAMAGLPVPEVFARDGEAAFRELERTVVADLGPAHDGPGLRRVIATGGGAVIDPRNRWTLYRHRLAAWIDAPPARLAERLVRSRHVRPLVASSADPTATLRHLGRERERFYAAAVRVDGDRETGSIGDDLLRLVHDAGSATDAGTRLLDAQTSIGRIVIGDGIAADVLGQILAESRARRAVVVSEPGAWGAAGSAIARRLESSGHPVEVVMLPQGEAAKRLAVVETAARELARLRVERGEPLIAIGGGALGDTAGFLAAVWLRGVPVIQVPTTLVAQLDSSIGGKTAVDLPEGKNLVGAFHQPAAIVIDVETLRSLPARQLRAALGEAVKMGLLGDERLLELLAARGRAIASGDPAAFEDGSVAELVERAAWAKVEVVTADERETAGRIALNLGHSIGHGLEAAAGYQDLLHGEAVAIGLRGACRIGRTIGVTPPERIARAEGLLDELGLGLAPLPYSADAVVGAMASDKKHAEGRLRWVLPTADGVEIRTDVPDGLVRETVEDLLAARPAQWLSGGGR